MTCVDKPARLVLIGGGPIPAALTGEILRLAKGANSRVVICPIASKEPDSAGTSAAAHFQKRHSCTQVSVFDFVPASQALPRMAQIAEMRAAADEEASLAVLDSCDVFFFTGGDQRIPLRALRGTLFESRLKDRWRSGELLVAGTSAGLQIQSDLALSGDQQESGPDDITPDEIRCTRIRPSNVKVEPGFGLLKDVILDQHFIVRQRQNRLLSAVIDHPQYLGIGVDEGTALVLEGTSGEAVWPRVIGDSCVFHCSARAASFVESNGRLRSVQNLDCGLTWEGATFPFPIRLA